MIFLGFEKRRTFFVRVFGTNKVFGGAPENCCSWACVFDNFWSIASFSAQTVFFVDNCRCTRCMFGTIGFVSLSGVLRSILLLVSKISKKKSFKAEEPFTCEMNAYVWLRLVWANRSNSFCAAASMHAVWACGDGIGLYCDGSWHIIIAQDRRAKVALLRLFHLSLVPWPSGPKISNIWVQHTQGSSAKYSGRVCVHVAGSEECRTLGEISTFFRFWSWYAALI